MPESSTYGVSADRGSLRLHRQKQPQSQVFVYAGADHGFNRDSNPAYHPQAAALAWERTLGFFGEYSR